jgi:hypothetical protein
MCHREVGSEHSVRRELEWLKMGMRRTRLFLCCPLSLVSVINQPMSTAAKQTTGGAAPGRRQRRDRPTSGAAAGQGARRKKGSAPALPARPCPSAAHCGVLEDYGLLDATGSRHKTQPAHAGVGGHHTTVSPLFFIAYPQTQVPAPSMLGPCADAAGARSSIHYPTAHF